MKASPVPYTRLDDHGQALFWRYSSARRWLNGSLMKRRGFDGHIVTMQQSGSHWLKNMLSDVLANMYGLPAMAHIQDDSIVGHPKTPPKYRHIPQIVHSHSYPHGITLRLPFLHYPKYLVLLRGLKESLIAHYERFNKAYYGDVDFSTYLRGDLNQQAYFSDIYSRIRFMNEWGRVHAAHPGQVMVVRYEDMQADAARELGRTCDFFGIEAGEGRIVNAVEANTHARMLDKPKNPDIETTVIRAERKPVESYFPPEDEAFFNDACRTLLLRDFGYGYPVNAEKRAA